MTESTPSDRTLDTNVRRKGSRYAMRAAFGMAIGLGIAVAIYMLSR